MSDIIYSSITGTKQGLITAGCGSSDSIGNRGQIGHLDQSLVYSLSHSMSREQHVNHQPIIFQKPVDKSSPLLYSSITNNESMVIDFFFYRLSKNGCLDNYYKISLTDATISDIITQFPHSANNNSASPHESIAVKYQSITWTHISAGTSSYSIWDDRIY